MVAAFDRSPGGCCCDVAQDGLFDIYGILTTSATFHTRGLIRMPMLFPRPSRAVGAIDYDSKNRWGWYCPTADVLPTNGFGFLEHKTFNTAVGGFSNNSEFVWALEKRPPFGTTDWYAVRYNAVTEEEVFAVHLPGSIATGNLSIPLLRLSPTRCQPFSAVIGGITVNVNPGPASGVSQEKWGTVLPASGALPSRFFEIDESGNIIYEEVGAGVHAVAPRQWPKGALANNDRELIVGDMIYNADEHRIDLENQATLMDDGVFQLFYFDYESNGNWAAVVVNAVGGWDLLINGDIKKSFNVKKISAFVHVFQPPHVCHPHETLGSGYIVVGMIDADADGNLVDPAKPYIAVCYLDGAEVWRTPRRPHPTFSTFSSDRWIYLTGWSAADTMPGTVGTVSVSSATWWYWAISHDGSQAFPCGQMSNDTTLNLTTWPTSGHAGASTHPNLLGPPRVEEHGTVACATHDCVKNSSLVEYAPPADIEDVLNSGNGIL